MEVHPQLNRRPLQTRSKRWVQVLAARMARAGFSPNGVSLLGLGFAGLGAGAILAGWWWLGAAGVQLRLLCNLLDGLIAVEHGKGDKLGDFFNEVPDRIADVALLLAAGYAANRGSTGAMGPGLGWTAALLAVGTAYLRQAGGAMGLAQDFCGPMAKQQRMFVLTVTLLVAGGVVAVQAAGRKMAAELGAHGESVLLFGLVLIVAGTAITVVRRMSRLMSALKNR